MIDPGLNLDMGGEDYKSFADAKQKILKAMVQQMAMHFDSIQIIATATKGEDSLRLNSGSGNWYTRYGSVSAWLETEKNNLDGL